ncbi:NifU family protein [bacterium]|nr:NifU family protein [bacterium]
MKFVNNNVFDKSKHEIDSKKCLMERKKNMPPIILDLRSLDEYKAEHLIGAHSIPMEALNNNINQIPPYAQIILYADADDEKTARSAKLLVENKFSDVSFVKGGISELLRELKESKDEVILSQIPKEEWEKKIEGVLTNKVRPTLAADGGGLKIVKIDEDKVYINYQGACSGCASAATGTLNFIRNTLSISLNHEIEVIMA